MKKLILIVSSTLFMMSCNQEELDTSRSRSDSLMSVVKEREKILDERETTINEFMTSFNEVERNLDCVAVRQHIIYSTTDKARGDLKGNQKDRINSHITAINNLMDENRKTIAGLQRKLRSSSNKNKKLEETIATLTDQIAQKDSELASLNEKLNTLNLQLAQLQSTIDTANADIERKTKTIQENTAYIHTAYYLIGQPKELREAKVINKTGGLLGIGKTAMLNENFDRSRFTKIDYTQTATIPVNSDKVKIITNHPTDAYRLEKDPKDDDIVRNLVIIDPEKFWSVSKYLVISGTPVEGGGNNAVSGKPKPNKSRY